MTVFGGSGFIGRHVVAALARDGWRVRVACRRPDLAFFLQPLGKVGQIFPVQANLRNPASVAAAVRGAEAVVNLVGVLAEGGKQKFSTLHAEGAKAVAEAAVAAGVDPFRACLGDRRGHEFAFRLRPHQGGGRGRDSRRLPRRGDLAPVGRLRPGGSFLQPLRHAWRAICRSSP